MSEQVQSVSAAVQRLSAAREALKDAEGEVRAAAAAMRAAEHGRSAAQKAIGAAVRGLRHELGQPALTVARGALGYYDPANSLREYIDFEDGEKALAAPELEKIIKWLLTNARAESE